MYNTLVESLEKRSRTIEKRTIFLKRAVKAFALEINTSFKINVENVTDEIHDIERRSGIIKVEMEPLCRELRPVAKAVLNADRKMKTLKLRIGFIEKALKRITANVLLTDGKIKTIKSKVATASTKQPYIKHHKFSVTK